MNGDLREAIRDVVRSEINRALPSELWLVNLNGADVVVPTDRLADDIATNVTLRLDIETTTVVTTRPTVTGARPYSTLTSRRPS